MGLTIQCVMFKKKKKKKHQNTALKQLVMVNDLSVENPSHSNRLVFETL